MSRCVARLVRSTRAGQSLVELAISLPMLLALLMGICDLGLVLYSQVQVAAAAGEAARTGARFPGDLTETLADNDAARAAIVRKAVFDPLGGTTTMSRLRTSFPNFEVDYDVQISYYPPTATSVTRSGDDMIVTVIYRQSVWFEILPMTNSGAIEVRTSSRVKLP